MAVSELAPQPVAFYAAVFFLVNMTYIFLIRELIETTLVRAFKIQTIESGKNLDQSSPDPAPEIA
jgi:hypothetical protein